MKELKKAGITYYSLQPLIDAQKIERIRQGLYRWVESDRNELAEVVRIVPNGIVCLYTAADVYEMTNFVSSQYHIAIPKKDKITLPEYPPIMLYYWDSNQFETGKSVFVTSNNETIPIYDKEKIVCDFIKFRNKVGIDLMKEVMKNYLSSKERNLSKLMEYGRNLRISTIIRSYLELLV